MLIACSGLGDDLGQYEGIGGFDSRDGINVPTPLTYAASQPETSNDSAP
jgi:hypothetical protein